jgi:hypothetical protein
MAFLLFLGHRAVFETIVAAGVSARQRQIPVRSDAGAAGKDDCAKRTQFPAARERLGGELASFFHRIVQAESAITLFS